MVSDGRAIVVGTPSSVTVLVYESIQHDGWNTHVTMDAVDVITGETESFGSVYQYPSEPTKQDIVDHIMDQLRHEVEEQMGLDPHSREEQ